MVGDTSHVVFTFTNTGSNTLRLDAIESSEAFFSDFVGPVDIPFGDSLNVNLYFAPAVLGFTRDTVWIQSNLPRRALACRGNFKSRQMMMLHSCRRQSRFFHPNPYNATTTIEFELPRSSDVVLNVYDVRGRLVTTLVDDVASAGVHSVSWTCAECASGLYFVRMDAGALGVQKLLLVKARLRCISLYS